MDDSHCDQTEAAAHSSSSQNVQRSLRLDLSQCRPPRIEPSFLQPQGRLQFPDSNEQYDFTSIDLEEGGCIGVGAYGGIVSKMVHRMTGRLLAVKRIRAHEIDAKRRDAMMRELKIIIGSQNCEDIVRFYGALFQDGDCWICMELMDCSLDKFYPLVYARGERLPQRVVGFVATAVVRALNYLKENLNIIHRDVKPSNILLDKRGFVKLCDFGISGYLVDSIAETQDVGCQIYMAPERLTDGKRYDIRSDVWSLGISLVEICIGKFPYDGWKSVFDQLQAVVHGDPPFLAADDLYSFELVDFTNQCLIKGVEKRPKFTKLREHAFFQKYNLEADPEAMANERQFVGAFFDDFLSAN